jgi:hypothetical protein
MLFMYITETISLLIIIYLLVVLGLTRRYQLRTPAMAAGLTDHVWSVRELLRLPLIYEEVSACSAVAG